ncbi:sulfotransferase [Elusimicrobiota bacterium]
MEKQIPVFIVSSGRTGSTILAKMLNRHPEILIASDLFEPTGPVPYFDRSRLISGEDFFKILSRPSIKPRLRYWRERATKERLFYPDDENLVSLLLCYAIPFLSDSPMGLFNELKIETGRFQSAYIADHFIKFFEYLRDRFNKKVWVERTGGSLQHINGIVKAWPDAKIVNNYRDGRETAISMQSYPFFRMYLQILNNPDLDEWEYDYYPPVEEFGSMWEEWTCKAEDVLDSIPDDRKLYVSYEKYADDTYRALIQLVNFIFDREKPTQADIKWATAESKNIVKAPIRFDSLDKEKQVLLEKACAKGLKRLGYEFKVI